MPKRKRKSRENDEGSSSSSSDNEEDEERAKLISALDPTLFSVTATASGSKTEIKEKQSKQNAVDGSEVHGKNGGNHLFKSNRPKESDPDEEFPKPYSLEVSPECQKFIAKKLTKALERTLKDVHETKADTTDSAVVHKSDGIFLLSSSKHKISDKDVNKFLTREFKQQKKPQIRLKRHVDGSESEDEDSKLRHVAVSAEWVLNKTSL